MDLVKLNTDSRALLESVADRLPADTVAQYRRLGTAGEWAELVDGLAASLVRRRVVVTVAEYEQLADLLGRFPAGQEGYAFLGDPQGVLAQLAVDPS
ncbi:hypothetical protein JOF56_009578 [Kibdelosporangium banguiense]|uniref:Uncharacterized protein n=1 Tax=Kibdelosporangium banguiense TaxID=1365924 RepID=A0ABS4TXR3_9PSEU|nr:hypothetical protein [Kibdelosporangium banguiense]MBP2329193.1 hypothetical protein [Kibdelosporangium banguiense]